MATMPEQQVQTSSGDARNLGGAEGPWPCTRDGLSLTGNWVYVGKAASFWYLSGFNFPSCPIPQGATISSATLTINASHDETVSVNWTIAAMAADDAATWSSDLQPYDAYESKTTASVDWTPDNWTAANWYQSPDISSIIQEIVNREGWVSENGISFIFYAKNSDETLNRRIRSYDGDNEKGAKLNVEYISGAVTSQKTIGSLPIADVATVSGLAKANVKDINGLS